MSQIAVENQLFSKQVGWPKDGVESFYSCRFVRGAFQQANLGGLCFEDCVFEDCNLSVANVHSAAFKGVQFIRCKLQGVSFYAASHFLFSVSFTDCQLDFASFHAMILKKMVFKQCSLRDAVFTQANLTLAAFTRCDLSRAVFQHTVLDKADLSTSYNYVIDPDVNSLKKARFSLYGLAGLLEKYDIEIEEIS